MSEEISGRSIDARGFGGPIGAQTLRLYERRGLLTPSRTDGGTRRYSDDDVVRLERISLLVEEGVNLAGVAQILDLEHRNSVLENDNGHLRSENTRLREQTRHTRDRHG
jgi:MerR family transcriptional regulator/heat shock protein HspR